LCPCPRWVEFARFVGKSLTFFIFDAEKVDVGIDHAIMHLAGPDLEIERIALRAIDQAMAVVGACLPAGRVTRLQHGLAIVLAEHQLAFKHVDELVLAPMPVPLRRLLSRRNPREIDAKLVEPNGVAKPLARTAGDRDVIGIRITSADFGLHTRDIDLGHVSSISSYGG